ncbi:hypothetical protein ACFE04_000490 [Oxalis oulophora]
MDSSNYVVAECFGLFAALDGGEKPTYIRFLVSNAAAGSVIGKGGSTITEFQSQSGARIQLSRSHEFFPGTSDRIILVSGLIDDVLNAVELVLAKLLTEFNAEEGNEAEPRTKVRLVVQNSFCGGIIGKQGSTIKAYIEDSHAGIKISPQDNNYSGISDRLVTITGTIEEQMRAINLILSKLSEDQHYSQSMNAPFSYAAAAYNNSMNYGPNGGGMKYQNNKEDRSNSTTIGVSDEHIGLVLGRGGRTIMEISQQTGARIKVSDRGDFMTGTNDSYSVSSTLAEIYAQNIYSNLFCDQRLLNFDRKVTITGSQRAVQAAEDMIMQKVAYASEKAVPVNNVMRLTITRCTTGSIIPSSQGLSETAAAPPTNTPSSNSLRIGKGLLLPPPVPLPASINSLAAKAISTTTTKIKNIVIINVLLAIAYRVNVALNNCSFN